MEPGSLSSHRGRVGALRQTKVNKSWRDNLDCDKRLLYESCGSSGSVVVFDEENIQGRGGR
ncbi:hypothetical protein LB505_000160 [Fusarium chuoi]|nr:hypothetical protein LB505_000160 [Fusarium chuoi]KAI1037075.1 hypothetical protein LB503_009022 [Fusarium chuoi]